MGGADTEGRLSLLAGRIRPDIEGLSGDARAVAIGDVFALVYTLPLAVAGLFWLSAVSVPEIAFIEWPTFLGILLVVYVLRKLDFRFFIEVTEGTYGGYGGTLESVLVWAAALVFGPTALWLVVLWRIASALRRLTKADVPDVRWQSLRTLTMSVSEDTLPALGALVLYRAWGGVVPLPGLWLRAVTPAFYATLAKVGFSFLVATPYFAYLASSRALGLVAPSRRGAFSRYWARSASWPLLVEPFGVLAAGVYIQDGLWASLFLVAGGILASLLAHALSRAVEHAQHRSRELERLEMLSRDIIGTSPDAPALIQILEKHAGTMFTMCQLEIRLFPDHIVVMRQYRDRAVPDCAWEWIGSATHPRVFVPGEKLPWDEDVSTSGIVMLPIRDVETGETVGGISIRRRTNAGRVGELLPAAQSLAAQIASALQAARLLSRVVEHERVEQELAVAAEIQASFMPRTAPDVPGWEIKAVIDSAREASGDFIDLIPLSAGRWGVLVADVSGKGLPAALYMALTRTLIRTFAFEHETCPGAVFASVNRRILEDTDDDLFVTAFYGVLDPRAGSLTYANAGHNPPYLLRNSGTDLVEELRGTGVPLGMLRDVAWDTLTVNIYPGETAVLYTDGVTEAQNAADEFFGEGRLVDIAVANRDKSALEMRRAIFGAVQEFVGDAPRHDDITLAILKRSATPNAVMSGG